jgi:hypothetical protein
MKSSLRIFGILSLAVFAAGQTKAQSLPPAPNGNDQQQQQQAGPPPSVARISFIRGDVSMRRGDSGDWVALALNTPLMPGDTVSTADGARAELQLDYANILRLSGHTEADIAEMSNAKIQIQIAQGLVEYSVLKGAEGDVEIDTPTVSIRPLRDGVYRVEVNEAGETIVIVRNGEVEVTREEGSTKVGKGEMITVHGTGADVQFKKSDARSTDEWDKWSEDRDRIIQNAEGTRRTNPYYTGASDLDSYGQWTNVPDYGDVWSPNVSPDWAPYRDGNWVWEPYYDWTWVSGEPWGWAPYHYGRWFQWNDRWCWWPGPVNRFYRPLWAPAYVSFLGFGDDWGFGFGFGSIGWYPIGPCDPFFPWFGFGFRFGFHDRDDFFRFRGRDFDRDDFGRRFPGAVGPLRGRFDERFSNHRLAERDSRFVTATRADQFGHGAGGFRAGVTGNEFRGGKVMTGSVPVTPTRASLSPTNRAANPSTIRNGGQQHFFGSTRQQNSTSGSFNEQSRQMQEAIRSNARGSANGQANGPTRGNGVMTQPDRGIDRSGTSQPPTRGNGVMTPDRGVDRSAPSQPPSRTFEGQGQRPPQPAQNGNGSGGWQKFTPQPNQPPSRDQQPPTRGNGVMTPPDRGFDRSAPSQPPTRGNGVMPPSDRGIDRSAPSQPPTRGNGVMPPSDRGVDRNAPSQPRYQPSAPPNNQRPPLDLRRPVVNDRQSNNGGGQRYSPPPPPQRNSPPPQRYSPPPQRTYSPPPSRSSGGNNGGGSHYSPPPSRSSGGSSGGSHGSSGGSSHGSSGGGGSSHHH